ncbi:hypothetical protein A4A38_05615 [Bacillus licheniformis]|nr:hypothetical protein A4A43_09650 [Bacillus licheniformis]OIS81742.1 hypothetical protein A4A40_07605 [Bacillus licheniformis]OIS82244.1 hypothetical protein A4A38_05615 [Bacillus licheniformis]OIS89963.1 hypothetical protein A4A42_00070 [Bacillus licheniformis]
MKEEYEHPTHRFNSNGELVPIQPPLCRKQRRMIKQAQKRRIKKLKKARFQLEWEKIKYDQTEKAKTKRKNTGSDR